MWRRYQNEIMIGLALLLLLGSVLFKMSMCSALETESKASTELATKIEDIAIMKKLWKDDKNIRKKIKVIESSIGKSKVSKFQLDKKKAHIILENLNANELNEITGKKLASIAVQIVELSIQRENKNYRLELRCKW